MAKKNVAKEEFFIHFYDYGDVVAHGPFSSIKDCEEHISRVEEEGEYLITKAVAKYFVEVPERKNILTKKEI